VNYWLSFGRENEQIFGKRSRRWGKSVKMKGEEMKYEDVDSINQVYDTNHLQ
jgi:hypothetical protein